MEILKSDFKKLKSQYGLWGSIGGLIQPSGGNDFKNSPVAFRAL